MFIVYAIYFLSSTIHFWLQVPFEGIQPLIFTSTWALSFISWFSELLAGFEPKGFENYSYIWAS